MLQFEMRLPTAYSHVQPETWKKSLTTAAAAAAAGLATESAAGQDVVRISVGLRPVLVSATDVMSHVGMSAVAVPPPAAATERAPTMHCRIFGRGTPVDRVDLRW